MERRAWIVFLVSWCAIALLTKTTPESAHEYSRLGTVESLVDRGTYQLDESIFLITMDKIYRDGHYYSHQTPLLPTLETPVYWVLRFSGARFNNSGRLVLTYFFTLLTNGLAFALTVIVLRRILVACRVAAPWCDIYAVLLPFGTWLLPYALVTTNHGISGLLLTVIVYLLLQIEWHGITSARAIGLGTALGLMAAFELLPLVSFAPAVGLYLVFRRDMTLAYWSRFAAVATAPVLAQAIINISITGDVIPAGFHHELFTYPGAPFVREELTGSLKFDSAGALLAYAYGAFFGTRGFLIFAPVLLLGLVAAIVEWRWWARARGVHLVLIGGTLLSMAVSLFMSNQYGGGAVGFRWATYLSPAMLVFLVPWLPGASRSAIAPRVVLSVATVSVVSMFLFASPKPWSILEVRRPPLAAIEHYFPMPIGLMRGQLLSR